MLYQPFPVPLTLPKSPVSARPVPVHVPAIAKRPTITGSRLDRYVRLASPRVSAGTDGGRAGNNEQTLPEKF